MVSFDRYGAFILLIGSIVYANDKFNSFSMLNWIDSRNDNGLGAVISILC